MPKPGGATIRRVPWAAQAAIRNAIGMARMIHMKSASPSSHHTG